MPSLPDVILHVVLPRALISEVSQPVLLAGEILVKVKQFQRRRRGLANGRGEDSWLQGGQGGLKLRGDEGQRCLLDIEALVKSNGFGNERGVKLEQAVIKESRPVPGDFIALLHSQKKAEVSGWGSEGNVI